MKCDISWVEAMFFTAMQAGYAIEGTPKVQVIDMPGHKEIRYEDGPDLLLVDRWCVNPDSRKSAGTTTIWYQGTPVWFMSYGGYYTEAGARFLKEALRTQYCVEGRFEGGRGPKVCSDPVAMLLYVNKTESNEFERFRGREEVSHLQSGSLGYHDYWGMSLL